MRHLIRLVRVSQQTFLPSNRPGLKTSVRVEGAEVGLAHSPFFFIQAVVALVGPELAKLSPANVSFDELLSNSRCGEIDTRGR